MRKSVNIDMNITDTDRIEALEKMGNIAVWQGTWSAISGREGDPIRSISGMDDDGLEVGDELVSSKSLREAIDKWITSKSK